MAVARWPRPTTSTVAAATTTTAITTGVRRRLIRASSHGSAVAGRRPRGNGAIASCVLTTGKRPKPQLKAQLQDSGAGPAPPPGREVPEAHDVVRLAVA